jgi:serine/threonine protein kinase/WD40 repeat protein
MEIRLEDHSSPGRPVSRLSVGDRLGRFEVLGPLGAGGMGDVYRARDSQLLREVAIKVLPTAFWRDPDRQRRFEREARAAASLNHPNIVAVHDAGIHEGVGFIVTELLEGETLRQRMNGRPLSARRAIEYAIQIASGLAAGHERGIVHRDVKPDNLFVTNDGRLKILDFGLARMIDSPDDGTATATLDGVPPVVVVGTAAYMSPEQARGLRTDHRSDIFSLGVVLYEMIAGFAPFRRSTPAETLGAILHDEPPELISVAPIAPAIERIVRHCLEKAPEGRFQSVRDLMFDLEALPPSAWTAEPRRLRQQISKRIVLMGVALLAVTGTAFLGYRAGTRVIPLGGNLERTTPSVQRLTELPSVEESPALSPDHRQVAFTATVKGQRQIFVRLLAGGPPVQITSDPVDHEFPRWSPDANALVYFSPARSDEAQGGVWTIPALGGSPRRVIDSIGGADVSRSGRLACFRLVGRDVQLVMSALDGTGLQVIAQSVAGYHRHPRWSPDGRWIAFQKGDGLRFDIFVIPLGGGEPRRLTDERNIIRGLGWLPDSSGIVYASSRGSTVPYLPPLALWEVRLDGSGHRQISPVDAWYDQPDVHSSGLVSAARMRMRFDIWKFPFERVPTENVRRAHQVTRQTGQVLTPTAAPDGSEIAFLSDSGGHGNLWVMSTQTGQLRQITFEADPGVAVGVPVWSPDGQSIAFVSSKGRSGFDFGVWLVDPDGTNPRSVADKGLGMAWSPDGRWIYYTESSTSPLYKVPASGGTRVRVRSEPMRNVIGLHDATLYYLVERALLDGRPEFEIRAATPEDGPSRALARVHASRVPSWQIVNPALSPNGEWLAMPLTDGLTTNIWALSTRTEAWRQVTDFGDRATFIARRVSWSSDGRFILAAVADGDADVVLLNGLIARP